MSVLSANKNCYLVIARKYRPKKLTEVVGQDHVIQTLQNAILTGRLAHAYLLVGPRGVGKTSTARLLAAALNASNGPTTEPDPEDPEIQAILEGRSLDVREIDGASNNGVEQVRDLRNDVHYPPQTRHYKIYIIDEVHMLSTAAFNALLKTLEEPPEFVKFIFATTEAQKVPATIISRCQRFDLRRIPTELIARHLAKIAEKEHIQVENAALHAIARLADGGMRDAQSMLDQMISYCGKTIKESDVLQIFGLPSRKTVIEILSYLLKGEISQAWTLLAQLDAQGKDYYRILSELVSVSRELLILQQAPELLAHELNPEELTIFEQLTSLQKPSKLLRLVEHLSLAESRMRYCLQPKIWLEVTFAAAAEISKEIDLNDILSAMRENGVGLADKNLSFPKINTNISSLVRHQPQPPKVDKAKEVNEIKLIPVSNPTSSEQSHNELYSVTAEQIKPHKEFNRSTSNTYDKYASAPDSNKGQTQEDVSMLSENKAKVSIKHQQPADARKLGPDEIEQFKNDPQIMKALDLFGARIMSIQKKG